MKTAIPLAIACFVTFISTLLAGMGSDTVWVGDRWFLTNPNAGRVVDEMPYDTVPTDPSIDEGLLWDEEKRITFFDHDCRLPDMSVSGN